MPAGPLCPHLFYPATVSNTSPFFFFYIVYVHDVQDIFIVMELHSGGELFDRIVGRPRFTEDEVRVLDVLSRGPWVDMNNDYYY